MKNEEKNQYWSMSEGAFACLHDSKRTIAFGKAIRNSVKTGDIVLELGAGTGILTMLALDAGAKHVYAVEFDKGNINSLISVLKQNGYYEKVTIIHSDATTIKIPEKVDYIICEMIATGLIEELQVPVMNNVLKQLKKTGQVLLAKYDIFVELVSSKSKFYNKEFNIIRYELPEMRDMRSQPLTKKYLVRSVDFYKINNKNKINSIIKIFCQKSGEINAIRLSGKTTFADGSIFKNSTAYDFPIILPLEKTFIEKNKIYNLYLSYTLSGGPQTLKYKLI